jgi:hypothetical protein
MFLLLSDLNIDFHNFIFYHIFNIKRIRISGFFEKSAYPRICILPIPIRVSVSVQLSPYPLLVLFDLLFGSWLFLGLTSPWIRLVLMTAAACAFTGGAACPRVASQGHYLIHDQPRNQTN